MRLSVSLCGCLAACCLPACLLQASEPADPPSRLPPPQQVTRIETTWFEVVAADARVATPVSAEARAVEEVLTGYFPPLDPRLARIIVRPVPGLGREPVLDVAPTGLITLQMEAGLPEVERIRWMIRAAAVRFIPAIAGVPALPRWLEDGWVDTVLTRLRPGLAMVHARALLRSGPPDMSRLFVGGGRLEPASAYLAVRSLSQVQDGRRRLFAYAVRHASGGDPRVAFLEVFGDLPDLAAGLQVFWDVNLLGTARELGGAAAVRDWSWTVRRNVIVEVEVDGALGWMGVEDLWKLRRERWVRDLARARAQEARLWMTMAPPAWYNVLLTAGQSWDALARVREREFRAARERLGKDYDFAVRLDREVRERIDLWDARLEAERP